MSSLLVLPFKLMNSVGGPLKAELVQHYREIGELLFDTEFACVDGNETIPLGIDLAWNSNLLSEMIDEQLSAADHKCVLVDLSRPSQHSLQSHHLINGFLNAVNADVRRNKGRSYLLLIPSMLPQEDSIRYGISDLTGVCEVNILANSGEQLGGQQINPERILRYTQLVHAMEETGIECLSKKLIRFPGHFKLSLRSQKIACTDYFFDGRLCEFEIVELIEDFVNTKFGSSNSVEVLYDSIVSGWLEASVRAYCVRHDKPPINMSKVAGTVTIKNNATVLLVVPLVESGNTIRELLPKLKSMYPNSNVTVLSVLSTLGSAESEGQIEARDWDGPNDIHYFLKVKRNRYSNGSCPSCKAGLPLADPKNPDPYTKLSSQSFWTLADDVGFGPENDVPPNRQSVGEVPQLRNLDPMNGTFLAYKIVKLLKSTNNKVPNMAILCPLEEGAHSIGSCLEDVYNIPVIRVPKHVFDNPANPAIGSRAPSNLPTSNFDESMETLWTVQLKSFLRYQERLTKQPQGFGQNSSDVVIMDEFCRSGATLTNLRKFAIKQGLNVRCAISVISFDSNVEDLHSLYDVSIPEPGISSS